MTCIIDLKSTFFLNITLLPDNVNDQKIDFGQKVKARKKTVNLGEQFPFLKDGIFTDRIYNLPGINRFLIELNDRDSWNKHGQLRSFWIHVSVAGANVGVDEDLTVVTRLIHCDPSDVIDDRVDNKKVVTRSTPCIIEYRSYEKTSVFLCSNNYRQYFLATFTKDFIDPASIEPTVRNFFRLSDYPFHICDSIKCSCKFDNGTTERKYKKIPKYTYSTAARALIDGVDFLTKEESETYFTKPTDLRLINNSLYFFPIIYTAGDGGATITNSHDTFTKLYFPTDPSDSSGRVTRKSVKVPEIFNFYDISSAVFDNANPEQLLVTFNKLYTYACLVSSIENFSSYITRKVLIDFFNQSYCIINDDTDERNLNDGNCRITSAINSGQFSLKFRETVSTILSSFLLDDLTNIIQTFTF
jgi:hypothetical protein